MRTNNLSGAATTGAPRYGWRSFLGIGAVAIAGAGAIAIAGGAGSAHDDGQHAGGKTNIPSGALLAEAAAVESA